MKCPTCYPSTERRLPPPPPACFATECCALACISQAFCLSSACHSPTTHCFLGMPSSGACCPLACLPRHAFYYHAPPPPHVAYSIMSPFSMLPPTPRRLLNLLLAFERFRFLVTRLQDRDNLQSVLEFSKNL